MSVFVSPGVYSRERDFSLYAPALSTTIFGVVGSASKGPMNQPTLITDEGTMVRRFGEPSADHLQVSAALRYLRKGRQLLFVRVGTGEDTADAVVQNEASTADTLEFVALSPGTWGNDIEIVVSTGTASGTYAVRVVYRGVVVEVYDNLRVGSAWEDDPNYVSTRINESDRASQYVSVTVLDDTQTDLQLATVPLTGGENGTPVDAGDIVGSIGDPPTVPTTGLQTFRNPENIDVNLLAVPGSTHQAVIAELLDICVTRADCMALLDTPYGLSVQGAVDWHNGLGGETNDPEVALNSSYGALYYPWLQIYDGFGNANMWVPPSGHVAQVIAFTDYVADPWWAPAGLNRARLSDVLSVEHSASQGERDYMYANGNAVNPIVNLVGQGTVIYGQRTLQRATTALDRINVRRLMLYVRKVVATSVRTLQFDQNDEILWMKFRHVVEPVLSRIEARRGVTGYKVICDDTTNTPETLGQNELHGRILLQPTRSAEILNVEFTLLPTGARFEEF